MRWVKDKITYFCLFLVKNLNRRKDRCLSQMLFNMAEDYDTRPDSLKK